MSDNGIIDACYMTAFIFLVQIPDIHPRPPPGLLVCGEGGEYETPVLDAPYFIRERIELTGTGAFIKCLMRGS
jgi:hypothetical protein